MIINKLEFQKFIDITAYFFVLLSVFFLPVSTTINALFIVAAFLAVFGVKFQQQFNTLKNLRVVQLTLVLLLILFIGVFYSSVPFPQAFHSFKKYGLKLFALITLMPLFCMPKSRSYIFYTLIAGAFCYSFIDVLDHYSFISIFKIFNVDKGDFLSAIPFSLYCAFAALLCLYFSQIENKNKLIWYSLLIYLCFYLYFFNIERTGMIVFVVMAFAFMGRKLNLKKKILLILPTLLIVSLVALSSNTVKSRFMQSLNSIESYQQGNVNTSIGLRIEFARYSFELIKDKPIFGYGAGSFPDEYFKIDGPGLGGAIAKLGDPHNSYLHLWMQFGIIGLIAFIAWLSSQWCLSRRLMHNEKILLQCFLLAFMLSCFSISAFYRSRISTLYITMAIVCMGNVFQPRKKARRYSNTSRKHNSRS